MYTPFTWLNQREENFRAHNYSVCDSTPTRTTRRRNENFLAIVKYLDKFNELDLEYLCSIKEDKLQDFRRKYTLKVLDYDDHYDFMYRIMDLGDHSINPSVTLALAVTLALDGALIPCLNNSYDRKYWSRFIYYHMCESGFYGVSDDGKNVLVKDSKGKIIQQKPGRFLNKIFNNELEKDFMTKFALYWQKEVVDPLKPAEYHIAVDDIQDVYTMPYGATSDLYTTASIKSLVDSCMRYDFVEKGYDKHCTEAYNSGDFECHYLTSDGKLMARCMVWVCPDSKEKYPAPVYAVSQKNADDLCKKVNNSTGRDPSPRHDWTGAKLLKLVKDRSAIFAPYLDVDSEGYRVYKNAPDYIYVCDDEDQITYTSSGHQNLQSGNTECTCCGEGFLNTSYILDYKDGREFNTRWCIPCEEKHAKNWGYESVSPAYYEFKTGEKKKKREEDAALTNCPPETSGRFEASLFFEARYQEEE